jgi:hypothetical protein
LKGLNVSAPLCWYNLFLRGRPWLCLMSPAEFYKRLE